MDALKQLVEDMGLAWECAAMYGVEVDAFWSACFQHWHVHDVIEAA